MPASLSVHGAAKEPISSSGILSHELYEAGRAADRTLRGHLRGANPTSHTSDSIKKPTHELRDTTDNCVNGLSMLI